MVEGTLSRMRSILVSLSLALLSLSLIAPVLLANSASDLPTCCRRNGKHHCARADMNATAGMPARPALRAIQCPLFPKAGVVSDSSKTTRLNVASRATGPHLFGLTTARPSAHRPRKRVADASGAVEEGTHVTARQTGTNLTSSASTANLARSQSARPGRFA